LFFQTRSKTQFMFNRRSFLHKAGLVSASMLGANLFQPAWSRNLHIALKNAEQVSPSDLAPGFINSHSSYLILDAN